MMLLSRFAQPFRPAALPQHALRPLVCLLGGAMLCSVAQAQPAGSENGNFIYQVRQHDTLGEIARTYLQDTNQWRRIADFNRVQDAQRLPIGKRLQIPLTWIPRQPADAVLEYAQGSVTVDGQAAKTGQAISAGQTVKTAGDGAAAVRLPDGGFVALPENSQASLEVLQAFRGTGLLDAIIDLEAGDLETEVSPQHQGVGRFEVRTPVTVTGVRGTHFRVRLNDKGSINEVIDGKVQLAADGSAAPAGSRAIAAGQGTWVSLDGATHPIIALPATPKILGATEASGTWTIDFAPVEAATGYLAQYSVDAAGAKILARQYVSGPPLTISLAEPNYFLRLMAISADDLRSAPSPALPLTGAPTGLLSADGSPVLTSDGQPVQLQDF